MHFDKHFEKVYEFTTIRISYVFIAGQAQYTDSPPGVCGNHSGCCSGFHFQKLALAHLLGLGNAGGQCSLLAHFLSTFLLLIFFHHDR